MWELEFGFEDVNRYCDLSRAPTPAAGLRHATNDHPARSARFRELLGPAGFGDELRAVLRVDGEPWAALALMRAHGGPAFDTRDAKLIAGLSAPLAHAVREHARRGPAAADRRRGPGLLLFDAARGLASVNDEACGWLDELDPDAPIDNPFGVRLPMVVLTTLMQARAIAQRRDDRHARVRMRSHASGDWLVCDASCLRGPDGRAGQTAVVIEPAPASEIGAASPAAASWSPRSSPSTQRPGISPRAGATPTTGRCYGTASESRQPVSPRPTVSSPPRSGPTAARRQRRPSSSGTASSTSRPATTARSRVHTSGSHA